MNASDDRRHNGKYFNHVRREPSILESINVKPAKPKQPTPELDAIAYAALAVVADAKKEPAALPPGPHFVALTIFASIDQQNWAANYHGLLIVGTDGDVTFTTTEAPNGQNQIHPSRQPGSGSQRRGSHRAGKKQ